MIPFGVADVKRAGSDVTLVATGWMVKKVACCCGSSAKEGISAEVIDPRTIAPLDVKTILELGEEDRDGWCSWIRPRVMLPSPRSLPARSPSTASDP